MKGTKWIAGMNSGLSFWHDKWLNDGSSRNLIEGPFQRGEEDLLLKDVIHHRDWSLGGLSFTLPSTIWQKIKVTPFHWLQIVWITSYELPHLVGILISKKPTSWLIWTKTTTHTDLLKGSGFGR